MNSTTKKFQKEPFHKVLLIVIENLTELFNIFQVFTPLKLIYLLYLQKFF